jgi:hypothetical protein
MEKPKPRRPPRPLRLNLFSTAEDVEVDRGSLQPTWTLHLRTQRAQKLSQITEESRNTTPGFPQSPPFLRLSTSRSEYTATNTMDILGHSNISLTMNTYAHVMPGMLRDAANLMDSVLAGESNRIPFGCCQDCCQMLHKQL